MELNFPVGVVLEEGVSLQPQQWKKKCLDWMNQNFTGYVVTASHAGLGLEESILLFRNGQIVGCGFELVAQSKEFFGEFALNACMNAIASPQTIVDVVSITGAQADLVTAFNEKMALPQPIARNSLDHFFPKKFDANLSTQLAFGTVTKTEKKQTFERFGLGSIFGKPE